MQGAPKSGEVILMITDKNSRNIPDLDSDATWWEDYYSFRPLIRRLVYSFGVASWRGQEEDLIEDIMQETARRILERSRKVDFGEAVPIHSLKYMTIAIASNYCRDIRRRDWRLVRTASHEASARAYEDPCEQNDLLESAIENVQNEGLFRFLAGEIANFPFKQRKALLIDLANRMSFDAQQTSLQKAFLEVGVNLEEYRHSLPSTTSERARHTALLHVAYKRLSQRYHIQKYANNIKIEN